MAMTSVIATAVDAAFKAYYDGQEIKSVLERTDPLLDLIDIKSIGGKNYPLPFVGSTGGCIA